MTLICRGDFYAEPDPSQQMQAEGAGHYIINSALAPVASGTIIFRAQKNPSPVFEPYTECAVLTYR